MADAMGHDQLAASKPGMLCDVDGAREDDRQTGADGSDAGERFTVDIGPNVAEAAHPLDLRRVQHGEHLVASRCENRRLLRGHCCGSPRFQQLRRSTWFDRLIVEWPARTDKPTTA